MCCASAITAQEIVRHPAVLECYLGEETEV
jgi:hypothetical protein